MTNFIKIHFKNDNKQRINQKKSKSEWLDW